MNYSVEGMCSALKISRSSFYSWLKRAPSKRELENTLLKKRIREIHLKSRMTYGSPRIWKELTMEGFKVSRVRVAKLMKQEGIRSKINRKYRVTTNSSHKYPIVLNHLNRQFDIKIKSQVWVSDITYIQTKEGWLYLTTIIDLWDRKVIGWSLSNTMYANKTVIPAWKMAVVNRKTEGKLIFHSDRGIQYACKEFVNHLKYHKNVIRSMSRKGNCWDNAVAESFFKSLKAEEIYHMEYQTRKEARQAVFEYIEVWYNRHRRHSYLKGLTILEFHKKQA